jgi:hypothetical protein
MDWFFITDDKNTIIEGCIYKVTNLEEDIPSGKWGTTDKQIREVLGKIILSGKSSENRD